MKIKTFYAGTMAEALQKVKEEFGRDALILSSKELPRRSALGLYRNTAVEVVAALDPEDEGLDLPAAAPATGSPASGGRGEAAADPALVSPSRLWKGREELHLDGEYSEMRRALYSLTRPAGPAASLFSDVVAYELYQDLVSNEINEWLAYKLLDEAHRALPEEKRRRRSRLARSVAEVARGLIRSSASQEGMPSKKVVAFLGPTGVGKTTAIAKLAARLALEKKKKVMLLTTDHSRIGAVDQLRTYAGLMGVPFRAVAQVSDLARTIDEQSRRDYILIDTAGRSQRDLNSMRELLDFFGASESVERHLVLSATTKSVDMQEIVDRFGICRPDHLLFTKLDETSTFGPIFNELVRTQKAPSYIADGQRVPEDLHAVPGDRIVNIVLNIH